MVFEILLMISIEKLHEKAYVINNVLYLTIALLLHYAHSYGFISAFLGSLASQALSFSPILLPDHWMA